MDAEEDEVMQRSDMMKSWFLASMVKRYHTWSTITTETVGHHSHGVAVIYSRYFVDDVSLNEVTYSEHLDVIRWILEHDLDELWTGDLPFPVKKRYAEIADALKSVEQDAREALGVWKPTLSPLLATRVKICDLLQMSLFGAHEVHMGNEYARPIMMDTLSAALLLAAGDEYAVRMINQFAKEDVSYEY